MAPVENNSLYLNKAFKSKTTTTNDTLAVILKSIDVERCWGSFSDVMDPIHFIRRALTSANQQGRSLREEMRKLVVCHFFGAKGHHILVRQDACQNLI